MVTPGAPEFQPWGADPRLRAVEAGPVSAAGPLALIGIGASSAPSPEPPDDLCTALFGQPEPGQMPVAFFTDHYCPNCRGMAEAIDEIPTLDTTLHELPVLGPDSVAAAKVALAAERQDAQAAVHRRLHRAVFSPTEAYVRSLAEGLGLDPDRLVADAASPSVAAALEREQSLAASLGFAAVPVTVIGRTVIVGRVSDGTLARVVAAEIADPGPCADNL